MAVETLSTFVPDVLTSGATITFPYPSGMGSANYDSSAARLTIGNNLSVGVGPNLSVAMGAAGAVATITGFTTEALRTARLTLRRLDIPSVPNVVTGYALVEDITANYTFQLADAGRMKRLTGGTGVTLTLPAGFPVGWNVGVLQAGAGAGTFAAASGASLAGGNTKTGGVDTACSLIVETNSTGAAARYVLTGSVAA